MSDYKIEKNIPMPIAGIGRGRPCKYPFAAMKIGDSFVTKEKGVRSAASKHGKNHGKRFIARKTPEGYRVWRVKK